MAVDVIGGAGPIIGTVVQWIFYATAGALIGGAGVVVLWLVMKSSGGTNKVKVNIHEQIGDSILDRQVKAKIVKTRNVNKLMIKGEKIPQPVPENKFFRLQKKGFFYSKVVDLFKYKDGMYVPMNIVHNSPASFFSETKNIADMWYAQQDDDLMEIFRKGSFMDKYGTYVAIGALFVLVAVMGIIFLYQQGQFAEILSRAASSIASSSQGQVIQPTVS